MKQPEITQAPPTPIRPQRNVPTPLVGIIMALMGGTVRLVGLALMVLSVSAEPRRGAESCQGSEHPLAEQTETGRRSELNLP